MSEQIEKSPQIELEGLLAGLGKENPGHFDESQKLAPENVDMEIQNKIADIRTHLFIWDKRDKFGDQFLSEAVTKS